MKMTSVKMKKLVQDRLKDENLRFQFDQKNDTLRIEHSETKKGLTVSLPGLIAKWEEKRRSSRRNDILYKRSCARNE